MTDDEIILNLWKQTKRTGTYKLINWLKKSDFFIAPSSTKFHGSIPGGLTKHSLNTYALLKQKVEDYKLEKLIPHESIIVTSLGHDLCKVGVYSKDTRQITEKQIYKLKAVSGKNFSDYNIKELTITKASSLIDWEQNGRIGEKPNDDGYEMKENFPIGHGEKSVFLLQQFITLTEQEALAIRWHMALFDFAVQASKYPTGYAYKDAIKKHVLVQLFMIVDLEASLLLEREWDK